jgi:hypothetical protein
MLKILFKPFIHLNRDGIGDMKNNTARQDGSNINGDADASDAEINERLVEVLKANTVRIDPPSASGTERRTGFFPEAYALLSLVGLMVVAYVYSLLVNKEA